MKVSAFTRQFFAPPDGNMFIKDCFLSEHVQKENHMLYLVITPIIIKNVKTDAMKKDENILCFIDSFQ